jgi:hypothetical protein
LKPSLLLFPGALVALAACTSVLGDFNDGNATANDGGVEASDGQAPLDGMSPLDAAHDGSSDACAGDACIVTCTGTMTACEGTCVDVTSAGTDCGRCGHDCGGGDCTSSVCQPKTLTSGLPAVKGFGVDTTSIIYSAGGTVSTCPLAGCAGAATPIATLVDLTLLTVVNGSVGSAAFVGNDPTITSLTENPSALFGCAGAGCPPPPLQRLAGGFPASGNYGFNELFGYGQDVYYQWNFPGATANHGISLCAGLSASACTSMVDIIDNGLPPLAADATDVYFNFVNPGTTVNEIAKCSNAAQCTTPTVVLSGVAPTAMTVYGTNLYYVTFYAVPLGGGPVFSCPTAGCTVGAAFGTLPTDTVSDITSDSSGVYFAGESTIYMCPLTGCTAAGPKAIATGQASPTFIHTDASFVYWVDMGAADAGADGASIVRVAK